MIYQFRCQEHGLFEVSQSMQEEHKARCPTCNREAQRIYLPIIFYFPNCLWNPDGSKQSPDELPPVPQDQNWGWHGVGESRLFGGGT